MKKVFRAVALAAAVCLTASAGFVVPLRVSAQATPPITLHVDASRAVQGLLAMHETIPVTAGALTLVYPKWIPGEHSPSGPIPNLAGIHISGGGHAIAWTRDPVDLYAFHLDVPAGVSSLDVDYLYLGANGGQYSNARLSTPNLLSLTWNKVILTPKVEDYHTQVIAPSLTLPGADWKYATALDTVSHNGADVTFKPVSQAMLVDSPLDAGINSRTWALGTFNGAPVTLAAFADTPDELDAGDATIQKFRNLVTQMHALYRWRHFDHYTFLLTLSDVMPGEGVEHHQSSDDGTAGDFLTDHAGLIADADLLPHEWNHSWDGKYRRPADLATKNLQDPMVDTTLWVYEGMTQFYGELQAERSGIWSRQDWLDSLAGTYAFLDSTRGRDWRPLIDTATEASDLYGAPPQWENIRRSVDYYPEGALMWLDADITIRRLSGGKRSLNDVARNFFGNGQNTGPITVTYTRADIVEALNAVQPYDWTAFLHQHLDVIAPHPPDPFTPGGYKLVYTPEMTALGKIESAHRHGIDMRFSLGIQARADGTVVDVIENSPAYAAGIGPGQKIMAFNDRALTGGQQQVDQVLKDAEHGGPIRILVSGGDVYRTYTIDYHGGPRFPHLERVPGTPDLLDAVAKPLAAVQ
ncbi:MAG TPA: hypothetical protein VFB22_08335 [Candidatus Baltobacteraceae bacterium]|nr:hypothetical protein [Candidatus Baltobacteraceae bacterium]